MRFGFAVLAAAVALPAMAFAQPSARMTDAQFLRASRCVTLAAAPQIKAEGEDMSWLLQAVSEQARTRDPIVLSQAKEQKHAIEKSVRNANSDARLAILRAQREEACATFLKQAAKL